MDVRRDIVTIGGSAGAVEALTALARALPADLPASVFVVVHVNPAGTSVLPDILRRAGPLAAVHAADGEPVYPGRIYVAPPDRHLLLYDGRIRLSAGPRENRNRPAIDPLFRSAARAYGPRVTGVILSGTLDDGVAGLSHIRDGGGLGIVQDPIEAAFPGMPQSAIDAGQADHVARLADIATRVDHGARTGVAVASRGPAPVDEIEQGALPSVDRDEGAAGYSCPDCGGSLWREAGDPPVLRCRVGHAFSEETLAAGQQDGVETALWAATRALAERVSLGKRMVERAEREDRRALALRYREEVAEAQSNLVALERLLFKGRDELEETGSE